MSKNKADLPNHKILLTGGHAATTAMSVVEELIRRSGNKNYWDIYWVGSKSALEGKFVPTLESKALPKLGVKNHPIITGRLQRKFTFWTIPSIAKIPLGFLHAFKILRKIKPDIILSFGGFAAFPVVVVGFFLRIPVVLHEQTMAVGRANKYSAPFAQKIAIARKTSKKYFPKNKCVLTGNPIMSQVTEVDPKKKIGSPPVIYVTGGSRGSRPINSLIKNTLQQLIKEFRIIHQPGQLDFEKFNKTKSNLSKEEKDRYEVYSTIDPIDIDNVYKEADIVISRAGANTVAEIIATKRPAILVPLPFSYLDEQKKNAVFAKDFGIAKIIKQDISPDEFLGVVYSVKKDWNKIVKGVFTKKSPDIRASQKLVDLLEKVIYENN